MIDLIVNPVRSPAAPGNRGSFPALPPARTRYAAAATLQPVAAGVERPRLEVPVAKPVGQQAPGARAVAQQARVEEAQADSPRAEQGRPAGAAQVGQRPPAEVARAGRWLSRLAFVARAWAPQAWAHG
jgi:hypothetical protein